MRHARDNWRTAPLSLRSRRQRGGQILIMAMLAMTLLIALVFYLFNVGDNTNRRLSLQNAADAAAVSGADWMARSMNAIAANNCAQSRMLALVTLFDAAPLAAEMTAKEMTDWERGLQRQLDRGVPPTKDDFLRNGLETLRARYEQQRDALQAFSDALNEGDFDMPKSTYWMLAGVRGPPPHGSMWRTAMAMEEFSDVIAESAGVLAQSNAVRFGMGDRADVSLLLPVVPQLPAKIGTFEHFRPTLIGYLYRGVEYEIIGDELIPGEQYIDHADRRSYQQFGDGGLVPDTEMFHRLGPWAKLYKWRYPHVRYWGGYWIPGTGYSPSTVGVTSGQGPGGGASRQSSEGGDVHVGGKSALVGYTAFGPYKWVLWTLNRYCLDNLPDVRFSTFLRDISKPKLRYMFHHLDFSEPVELDEVHYPRWVHTDDYPAGRAVAGNPGVDVTATCFYVQEIVSSKSKESSEFLTPGTFVTNAPNEQDLVPERVLLDGWVDPIDWGIDQLGNYVWYEGYTYLTNYFPEIGINARPIDPDEPYGALELHTVYVYDWYVWGGVDIGGTVAVRNPCNWDAYEDLPRPMLYDVGADGENEYYADNDDEDYPDPDEGARRRTFTYLGVAQDDTATRVWPQQFAHGNPMRAMAAVAQAKVFNNNSWDLWTQDWQAQLMPVSKWDDWMMQMEEQELDVDLTDEMVLPDEYARLFDYLRSIDLDMAEDYFRH